MTKYIDFDKAIINAIKDGKNTLTKMEFTKLFEMAKPFCVVHSRTYSAPPEWRIVDRRLQALRKAGKIAYDRSKQVWSLTGPIL